MECETCLAFGGLGVDSIMGTLISIAGEQVRRLRGTESRLLCFQTAEKIAFFYGPCRTRECTQPSFSSIDEQAAQLKWPSCWSHSIKTNLSEKRSEIYYFFCVHKFFFCVHENSKEKCLQLRSHDGGSFGTRHKNKAAHSRTEFLPHISGRLSSFWSKEARRLIIDPFDRRMRDTSRETIWRRPWLDREWDIVRSCRSRKTKQET